jgi:hypothetical protein
MAQFEQDSSDETGIKDNTPKGNSAVARARERKAHAALQLSLAGIDWSDIAESVGYPTARAARVAVERTLEAEVFTKESQAILRAHAGKQLQRLTRAVWPKAINPDSPEQLPAAGKAREMIADFRKLYGLDAPTEMVITSPGQQELDQWVAEVLKLKTPALEEPDIFDAEVISDTADPEAS